MTTRTQTHSKGVQSLCWSSVPPEITLPLAADVRRQIYEVLLTAARVGARAPATRFAMGPFPFEEGATPSDVPWPDAKQKQTGNESCHKRARS